MVCGIQKTPVFLVNLGNTLCSYSWYSELSLRRTLSGPALAVRLIESFVTENKRNLIRSGPANHVRLREVSALQWCPALRELTVYSYKQMPSNFINAGSFHNFLTENPVNMAVSAYIFLKYPFLYDIPWKLLETWINSSYVTFIPPDAQICTAVSHRVSQFYVICL